MIEPIMYFGIGFLFATLIGLVLIPLVHNRAVRLTLRRIEASTPVSLTEIQADKDQLRAEFAMATRRLEMSVDQLKARTTSQLVELGKKTEAINTLKGDLSEKSAAIFALESREKSLRDQVQALEEELAVKTNAMQEAVRGLAEKEGALARLTADLGDQAFASDSQRIEIVALRTQVGALKSQIDHFEADVKAAENSLGRARTDADGAAAELGAERRKAGDLSDRLAHLERQLTAQTGEAETLARRVQDLEARLADRERLLAERDNEASRLRGELDKARGTEAELRAELAGADRRHATAAALQAAKAQLEEELKQAREDEAALQRALAAARREAEASGASERSENALLRERIDDIATEVARLTLALEGPDSPIEAILREERSRAGGANGGSAPHGEAGRGGSLVDRIRALQARAARMVQHT